MTSDGGACSPRRTRKRARDSNHSEEIEVAEETKDEEEEEEKIVTATQKGVAVLDQWLPDYVKTNYHVLQLVSLVMFSMLTSSSSCILLYVRCCKNSLFFVCRWLLRSCLDKLFTEYL